MSHALVEAAKNTRTVAESRLESLINKGFYIKYKKYINY